MQRTCIVSALPWLRAPQDLAREMWISLTASLVSPPRHSLLKAAVAQTVPPLVYEVKAVSLRACLQVDRDPEMIRVLAFFALSNPEGSTHLFLVYDAVLARSRVCGRQLCLYRPTVLTVGKESGTGSGVVSNVV